MISAFSTDSVLEIKNSYLTAVSQTEHLNFQYYKKNIFFIFVNEIKYC